jgi:riboflavin kinase / FMN adenylyltransferase
VNENVRGIVIYGDGVGTKLGYPTANLRMPKYRKLKNGIYAARVRYNKKEFQGIIIIGVPSESNSEPKLEIHILDFDKMIYGKWLSAIVVKKIRKLQRYSSQNTLVKAIENDCQQARKILNMI